MFCPRFVFTKCVSVIGFCVAKRHLVSVMTTIVLYCHTLCFKSPGRHRTTSEMDCQPFDCIWPLPQGFVWACMSYHTHFMFGEDLYQCVSCVFFSADVTCLYNGAVSLYKTKYCILNIAKDLLVHVYAACEAAGMIGMGVMSRPKAQAFPLDWPWFHM